MKYTVATLLYGERGEHLIHGLERAWIRHFGLPQCLCTDEGRGGVGDEMNAWTTQHAVEHIVAPAESHRLALVERRHTTLRRAIEIYLDDMKVSGSKGIRKALTYVVPQLNDTLSIAGFTPSQWLLGKILRLPGGLSNDGLSPAQLGDHNQFEQLLRQRAAAKKALISASSDGACCANIRKPTCPCRLARSVSFGETNRTSWSRSVGMALHGLSWSSTPKMTSPSSTGSPTTPS